MSSNPFRKRASVEQPRTSQDNPIPTSPEPQTLSASPNRSSASSWEVVDIPPPSPALRKRSPPPRPPSRNIRSHAPPPEIMADPFNPSPVAPIISKKIPPLPPLSRRHSVQSSTNPRHPSTPVGNPNNPKTKPPPPPIRRHKSTNSRAQAVPRPLSALSIPHPPPPPPPRRNRSSTANSYESRGEPPSSPPAKSSPTRAEPAIPIIPGTETDILIDLEKLQREVDELRGKYEGKGIGTAVST